MALLEITHRFAALGGQSRFSVVLPETGAPAGAPVVLLLHGASDNGSGWLRFTAAERYAAEKRIALVLPDARNSCYADMASGARYFTFVTQELPAECRRLFGLSARREDNFVVGLSMGGYGALKCALTCPGQYAACAAFSSVIRPERLFGTAEWPLPPSSREAVFGGKSLPPSCDLFALAEKALDGGAPLPELYLACGEQDPLYAVNREWHAFLTEKNIPHVFRHGPGAHCWEYWDAQLKNALDALFEKPAG